MPMDDILKCSAKQFVTQMTYSQFNSYEKKKKSTQVQFHSY